MKMYEHPVRRLRLDVRFFVGLKIFGYGFDVLPPGELTEISCDMDSSG